MTTEQSDIWLPGKPWRPNLQLLVAILMLAGVHAVMFDGPQAIYVVASLALVELVASWVRTWPRLADAVHDRRRRRHLAARWFAWTLVALVFAFGSLPWFPRPTLPTFLAPCLSVFAVGSGIGTGLLVDPFAKPAGPRRWWHRRAPFGWVLGSSVALLGWATWTVLADQRAVGSWPSSRLAGLTALVIASLLAILSVMRESEEVAA
jgi:hypothetical protein